MKLFGGWLHIGGAFSPEKVEEIQRHYLGRIKTLEHDLKLRDEGIRHIRNKLFQAADLFGHDCRKTGQRGNQHCAFQSPVCTVCQLADVLTHRNKLANITIDLLKLELFQIPENERWRQQMEEALWHRSLFYSKPKGEEMIGQVQQGEIVKYRLNRGPSKGQWRPAMVIRTWPKESGVPGPCPVQLAVFVDRINDGFEELLVWETSVTEGLELGQYSRIVDERGKVHGLSEAMTKHLGD